jgi:multidrug efflux pump subunit AcrA (membrane-fusion protein)
VSLVELRQTNRPEPVSGGAMDRVVVRKKIDKRILIGGAAAAVLVLVSIFWLFAPRSDSMSVTRDRLTIATIESGTFEDFLPLRARVTPLVTVYLDAVEGGRVDQKLVEDGAHVTQGQMLAVLSNAELQLSTLEKQAEVEQQLNNMRSQELALTQTRNSNLRDLNQAETDMRNSKIKAPIDGVVVSRAYDVGQTVAASFQAPTLFTIAQDLTKMQVSADVSESDIGMIKVGEPVRFTVDAYPEREFRGKVSQIRLNATVNQNVVTYPVIVEVPNEDLLLRPTMTANVIVDVATVRNILRVPNAALRFRPEEKADSASRTCRRPRRSTSGCS